MKFEFKDKEGLNEEKIKVLEDYLNLEYHKMKDDLEDFIKENQEYSKYQEEIKREDDYFIDYVLINFNLEEIIKILNNIKELDDIKDQVLKDLLTYFRQTLTIKSLPVLQKETAMMMQEVVSKMGNILGSEDKKLND